MAIVYGVLAALAIISAVGSASKVARQGSSQPGSRSAAKAVQKSIETVQKAIETPALPPAEPSVPEASVSEPSASETFDSEASEPVQAEPQSIESSAESASIEPSPLEPQSIEPPVEPVEPQSIESVPTEPVATDSEPVSAESPVEPVEPQSIEPQSTPSEPTSSEPAAESDAVTKELVDSIMERMPDVPMAASLLVNEVVNPESNDLGVQLDRPNYPIDPQETPPTHHGNNLIDEIAVLDQGDRIKQLASAVENPNGAMRVSAAYVLGDLATRTHGSDRDEIMAILLRLSQDVDPQVRVQAANALGNLGNPVMGE